MASLDHIIVLMMENHSFDRVLGACFAYLVFVTVI
jgi:phospholipase C